VPGMWLVADREESISMKLISILMFALPLAAQFPILIDAGGPGDQYFSPKQTCAAGGTCITTSAAMGEPPMNTLRFGYATTPFSYSVPLPNGLYDVTLGFAEPTKTLPGQRVFIVTVQGEASAPIDLVKLTGGPNFPYMQTWASVVVRAGMLTMTFAPAPGNGANAIVNSIQIQPAATPGFTPQRGTIVVCQPTGACSSYPDGSSVLYRTLPPPGPGPVTCPMVGTGAITVDENGYLYVPSPPWWNMATNQANPAGVTTCTWLRFGPGVSTWPNDRPPGQPTTPTVAPPTAVLECGGPTSAGSDCTGLY
jgi:malectin (di-glucose binding ER protein)